MGFRGGLSVVRRGWGHRLCPIPSPLFAAGQYFSPPALANPPPQPAAGPAFPTLGEWWLPLGTLRGAMGTHRPNPAHSCKQRPLPGQSPAGTHSIPSLGHGQPLQPRYRGLSVPRVTEEQRTGGARASAPTQASQGSCSGGQGCSAPQHRGSACRPHRTHPGRSHGSQRSYTLAAGR